MKPSFVRQLTDFGGQEGVIEVVINFRKIVLVGAIFSSPFLLAACYQAKSTTSSELTGDITVTDDGFSPVQATVKSGDGLTWANNSAKKIQIGSDPHPTHTANSQLSNGQFVLEIAPGATATVTLTKKGTWGYHDHLNPGVRGKVVVE